VRYSRDQSEFDRAIAFLDATFALALTLLVTTIELDVSHSVWESLGNLDDSLGTPLVAFGIAFAIIANFWLINHRMVASFAAIDYPVIVAFLFLIAAIVLLPFSTEAVGEPGLGDLPLPTAVMAINVAAAAILTGFLYWLAWKRDLLEPRPDRDEVSFRLLSSAVPAAIFLGSIPIAYLVSPDAAQVSWISLIVVGRIFDPERRAKRKSK